MPHDYPIMRDLDRRRAEQERFLWEREMNRLRLRCLDNPCALLGWSIALAGAAAAARSHPIYLEFFTELVLRGNLVEIDLARLHGAFRKPDR